MRISFSILNIIIILLFILINPAGAVIIFEDESISADTVINDDVIISGDNVIIQGTVLGDVIATGGQVEITGNVTGDLMVGAGRVIIDGVVGDDLRVGAGELIINGHVGDDLIVFAGSIIISDDAKIGGDIAFGSGQMDLKGMVQGNVSGGAGDFTLAGQVGGDVDLEVENLNILQTARINGNLKYSSPEEVSIASGIVGESIEFIKEERKGVETVAGSSVIGWLIRYLFLLVLGLVALALMPNRTVAIARAIPENPLKNLVFGLVLLVAGFLVSILLLVTVIGIPLGIILLFETFLVMYAARLFFGLWLGRLIFSRLGKESRPWMDMVLGLFVLFIFTSLPWVGGLICLMVTFVAIGGLFIEQKKFYKELREKNML
ncbi:MAG: hypothetical protein E4G94_12270 [ANME-2 cluster archaeon]|nr:MAG: hypothetical protein E4G94_12270 [ANME-2 cluster archaeon]HUW66576.1 hypothetical protein [Candidatus Nanoarchaeia archaeon]